MLRNFKNLAVAVSVAATTLSLNAFAGGPELAPAAPSMASGFFVGLGGGYNTEQLRNRNSFYFDTFVNNAFRRTYTENTRLNNQTYNLSPTVQLGYLSYENGWMWGVQGIYTYLNSTTISNVPTDFFRSQPFSFIRVQPEHKFSLLLMLGMNLNDSNVAFVGLGPSVIDVNSSYGVSFTNGVQPLVDFSRSRNTWAWGGSAQLGWLHYFSPTWFLSTTYTWSYYGRENNNFTWNFANNAQFFPNTRWFSNNSTSVTSQQIVVAINKTFDL